MKVKFLSLKPIRSSLFLLLTLCILGQPISANILDAEQHAVQQPFNSVYDYDFKYSPENFKYSSQANDVDEIDNNNYDIYGGDENPFGYSFRNNEKRSSRIHVFRRGCVPRNGACDHRPKDCCYNSSCRCNLWGSNCRCQRMGLFQKWG